MLLQNVTHYVTSSGFISNIDYSTTVPKELLVGDEGEAT
jgi:hypothetical protein